MFLYISLITIYTLCMYLARLKYILLILSSFQRTIPLRNLLDLSKLSKTLPLKSNSDFTP